MVGMEIDPRQEARAAVRDLLDKLTWLALTVGVTATVVGLVRVTRVGWHINVIIDQLVFVLIVVVLLLRKRLPISLVVTILIALGTAVSFTGFLTAGLGTMSFVILTACCTVVGAVFGIRAGFVYLGGSIVIVGVIGKAVCGGTITNLLVSDPYLLAPQAWVSQLSGYAGYAAVILVVSGALQTRLSNTLSAVSRQAVELRESEARYRLLADNMRDVLFLQNMEFAIEYASPSAERLFGYPMEELLEINVLDIFTAESRERAAETFQHALARADDGDFEVPPVEFEYIRKDGSTFWGEVTPTFIRDLDGQIVGSQGLLRDITVRKQIESERERLEWELRQSEKLKAIGQLAGGIAHDFNNQLAPIMAHADLLARGFVDADSVAAHARKILAPASNAADLTGKLLAFARRGSYEHRAVDMHEVINEVAEILTHGIDRRIQVKRHYEAASAVVEGDRTQLQNALLNLALNSRDAMPDGGEIVFKTRMIDSGESGAESQLVISVEDTGEGMDDVVRARAFEPFFSTKAPGHGTGMGLAAAYGTVASHGGRIEIESRVGEGTTITVVLAVSAASTLEKVDTMAERLAPGVGRVMVIDDEDGVRAALSDLLESLGFSVVAFGRALEGTAFFEENWRSIDFVVLDLVLPDLSGRQALTVLQSVNPEVRVLLVSGYTADEEIQSLLRSDTIEFLEKPFLLADLAESLTRLSGAQKTSDQAPRA